MELWHGSACEALFFRSAVKRNLAANLAAYDFDTGVLTVRAAMKGPCSSAPRGVTKERSRRQIILDAELREWIEKWVNQHKLRSTARRSSSARRRVGPASLGSRTRCTRNGTAPRRMSAYA